MKANEDSRRGISLKTKLLFLVGSTLALLMLMIFVGVALTGRALLIRFLKEDAVSVAKAFAVPVMEILIYSESGYIQREDQLDKAIDLFVRQENRIREITVFDPEGIVISGSNLTERVFHAHSESPLFLPGIVEPIAMVHRDSRYGWTVSALLPLKIGNRNWGFLEILLNAQTAWRNLIELFWTLTAVGILVTGGVFFTLLILLKKVTNSLTLLAGAMDRLDLDSEEQMEMEASNDEIGTVIRNFQKLRLRLAESRLELVEAQKQIYQAEKLASIGRLASGVAHEISNPLNGIRQCIYAIQQEPKNQAQTKEFLSMIDDGITHVDAIVKKLLQFARKQKENSAPIDVNQCIQTVVALLEYRSKQNTVNIELRLSQNLPPAVADAQLFQEVIMNLLLNSFDAVQTGGKVLVSTSVDETGCISIVIADDGTGISESDLPHIFEPFFTTKEPGKGTGLGLSVVQNIVAAYGGTIQVETCIGTGSTFTLTLPTQVTPS